MTNAQSSSLTIRKAGPGDLAALESLAAALRLKKEPDYFQRNLERASRDVFIAAWDGADAGYCILNWQPKYAYYRAEGIPETQDLNVLPDFRQRGIGAALIEYCEAAASARGKTMIGISVGLTSGFGAAQRLYVKMGYVPDGFGVTYDRKIVLSGEFRSVDENLCLMMGKKIRV